MIAEAEEKFVAFRRKKIECSNPTSTKPLKTCHLMAEIDQVIEHGGFPGAFSGAEK